MRLIKGIAVGAFLWWVSASGAIWSANAQLPHNLANKAHVSANSEHSANYLARFVADGKIPAEASQGADRQASWCVHKASSGDRGELVFVWDEPVAIAEVVYWGRTSWMMTECWRQYELFIDDAAVATLSGQLLKTSAPQRIQLPQLLRAKKLTLRFLNSHGGANPGAAEIMIFSQSATDAGLAAITPQKKQTAEPQLEMPPEIAQVDPAALAQLILSIRNEHGDVYSAADEHQDRLAQLNKRLLSTFAENHLPTGKLLDQFKQLQRDVLLFDIDRMAVILRHEINASHVYTYHYEGFRAGGGLYTIRPNVPHDEPVLLVDSSEGQILDLDVSHDGRTILFSWRRNQNEGYHLWTVQSDGTELKRITDGEWHDYNACWLPDGDIAFLSTRAPQFAYCWHAPVGTVYRMSPDGSNVIRLSANYLNDFTPSVLADGRIIYSRWEYVDRPAIPIQSLWTMNPDGTGLMGYFGNRVLSPGTFMEPQQIPGSSVILCTMTGHNGPTRGAIGLVDRRRGVNAQAAITNLTPETPIQNVDQGNGNTNGTKQYSSPYPLDSQRFICSVRGPLLVRTIDGKNQAIAYTIPDNELQYFNARPLRSRMVPPVRDSAKVSADYSPLELLESFTSERQNEATIYLTNVNLGLGTEVGSERIHSIRIVRELQKTVRIDPKLRAFGFQFPVISCGATYAGKMVIGDVEVDDEGAACFRVPAGVPLYFMALDGEGRAVQRMRSFTHLMPGEMQGCIGCHEHRLSTPGHGFTHSLSIQPRRPVEPEWGVGGFDYSRIVQPVLDQYCTQCHNPFDSSDGIDLTGDKTDYFNVSYDVLARENQGPEGSPFVNWIPTYNGQEQNILKIAPKQWGSYPSRLAELIRSGHPDKNGQLRFDMDDASRRRIYAWIDLNVPYYGSSETAYPELPGCRQIVPEALDSVLQEVAMSRCNGCHVDGNIPRREWLRITHPEKNPFLLAPLARSAGGIQRCSEVVFTGIDDPDYQKILATFRVTDAMLQARPRIDMPGGKPAADVCRICQ